MQVEHVEVTIVEAPQLEPLAPYRSHVRTSSVTRSAIVRVETDDGITGWGEYNVNFLEGVDGDEATIRAQWLVDRDPLNIAEFHRQCPLEPRLKSGLELAIWDIRGKALGQSVAELLGGVLRPQVEVAACMGIQSYQRAGELATWYVEQGFTTLKTKAGADFQEDLEMVRGIRDATGNRLKLRIDPNCAYSLQDAAKLAKALEPYDLQYLEQPILAQPLKDAHWLRQQTKTPIALNESVVGPGSVLDILQENAAQYVLPDTHIAGGIWPCVAIGQIADAAGIPCIMHCGHDLGPKTAAMLHVAASCPAYPLANDTTYYGLEDDILATPFVISEGRIATPTAPGLGIDVDLDKLRRYAV